MSKNRYKLYEEAAKISKLIENTGIEFYSCIKYKGTVCEKEPVLDNYEDFEFALFIVEDKPVFKGDILYDKEGRSVKIETTMFNTYTGYSFIEKRYTSGDIRTLTWNYHTNFSKIKIDGIDYTIEIVSDTKECELSDRITICGKTYKFANFQEARIITKYLQFILEGK